MITAKNKFKHIRIKGIYGKPITQKVKKEIIMNNKQTIDIIVASSDEYMKYTTALMVSAIENTNKNYHLHFHILSNNLQEKTKEKVSMLHHFYDFDIDYTVIKSGICLDLPFCPNKHVNSKVGYLKLLSSSLFPNLSRALILDVDIIIIKDLAELWEINIDNYCVGAVPDFWYKKRPNNKYPYFNAGVLYANLTEWRKIDFEKQVLEIIPTKKLQFPEQDLFNEIFAGKTLYLDWGWNMETCAKATWFKALSEQEKQEVSANPKIIHYIAEYKPWDDHDLPYAEYWWYYARFTPFYENMLKDIESKTSYNHYKEAINVIFNYHRNVLQYWRCKLLYNLTRGKKKAHYMTKKDKLKEKIKMAKNLLK